MRLTQYLTEGFDVEYISGVLQKDCKPYIINHLEVAFLNLWDYTHWPTVFPWCYFLYRGSYKSNDPGIIILDKFFNKKFGWMPRSTGVFYTGDFSVAGQYGNAAYSIWPIGPFKFLWHPRVPDLFEALWDIQNTWGYWIDHPEILESFVKDYTDKNFQKAIKSKHEVMISCKNYYLVRSSDSYDKELIGEMK